MQFIVVSELINGKEKFCFLSLGDGFPFVLIDYFGVFFICIVHFHKFLNFEMCLTTYNSVGFRGKIMSK